MISTLLEASGSSIASDSLSTLPNTVSVSFKGLKVSDFMPFLLSKVACSAGAACHSHGTGTGTGTHAAQTVSSVLLAIHVPEEYQLGTLRLSFGRHTTREDIIRAVDHLQTVTDPRYRSQT